MAIRASKPANRRTGGEKIDLGEEIDLTAEESFDAGDVDIEELWEEHRAALHRICAKIVGDPVTADDMVQETYLRALKHRDKLENRPSLMPWLATVARRRSLDEIRARKKVSPHEFIPEDETPDNEDPEARVEVDEVVGEVGRALRVLNEREQRLLRLQVHDDLSLAELAEAEGSTVDSVRSVLVRARAKLRDAITRDVGVPAAAPLAGAMLWLRRKLEAVNLRVQRTFSSTPLDRVGEVVTAGVVTVALGAAPAAVDTASTDSSTRRSDGAPIATATDRSTGAPSDDTVGSGAATSASDAPTPDPAPESLPGSAAVDLLAPPDDVETTDDAAFASFAASNDGRTVLAAGTRRRGCATGCTVLFRSRDGGATWERLPAEGITGAFVVAAPDYPRDPRVFANGDGGLSVSRDGGHTFEVALAAGPAPITLSPAFGDGDDRVFVGTSPAVVWDDETRSATPLLGPPVSPVNHFAFEPGYPTQGDLLVGSAAPGGGDFEAAVYRCRHALSEDSCIASTPVPAFSSPPQLAVLTSGTVLAWTGHEAQRSTDGTASFAATAVPGDLHVTEVASDQDGTVFASTFSPSGAPSGILRSADDGRTWALLGSRTVLGDGVATVSVLPDGRLLAAPLGQGGGDIACSDDGGETWSVPCS